jgi:chloride channel 3/4/5
LTCIGLYHDRYANRETSPNRILICGPIDWVQDAAREQAKRKSRRKQAVGLYDKGQPGWRYQLWKSYDAAQAWIVVTIIGVAIGLNAALLNIITEWLSDVKMGYCETGFYLNENFCCWGEENGEFVLAGELV